MSNPKVSVIIPCYNSGKFIDETLNSVLEQTYQDFEIIIVNDGSTDSFTIEKLNSLNVPKIKVIHTSHQERCQARNTGIKEARGEYILPLDSDDKIHPEYMEKAVNILDNQLDVGIVYCLAKFFGARNDLWMLPEFNQQKILLHNCIFCSAFFRKSDFEKTNGYNPNMIYGWEDHDFWLSLLELGVKVHRIDEVLFYYRQTDTTFITGVRTSEQRLNTYQTLLKNHSDLYKENIDVIFEHMVKLQNQLETMMSGPYAIKNHVWNKKHQVEEFIKDNNGKKICFYGAGKLSEELLNVIDLTRASILGFIDNNSSKVGQNLGKYKIYPINDLINLKPDIIILSVLKKSGILENLDKYINDNKLKIQINSDLSID